MAGIAGRMGGLGYAWKTFDGTWIDACRGCSGMRPARLRDSQLFSIIFYGRGSKAGKALEELCHLHVHRLELFLHNAVRPVQQWRAYSAAICLANQGRLGCTARNKCEEIAAV